MLNIKWDKDGLVPVIVQDYYSKKVLTLAYMNEESLKITIEKQLSCFFSRSRNELWLKGETSKNYQHVVSIQADCDNDALVMQVIKDGPACHLNRESCFEDYLFVSETKKPFAIEELYQMLKGRKEQPKEGSYTTYLFEKGLDKILKKIGEECTEVIIEAKGECKSGTVYEIADLAYHVLVLMVEMGISMQEIFEELSKRHIVDVKVKQEKMS